MRITLDSNILVRANSRAQGSARELLTLISSRGPNTLVLSRHILSEVKRTRLQTLYGLTEAEIQEHVDSVLYRSILQHLPPVLHSREAMHVTVGTWGSTTAVCFYLRGWKASNCGMHSTPDNTANQRESGLARCPIYRSPSRLAASASSAKSRRNAKNAGDCPIKSPIAIRKLSAPVAAPVVLVGRIMEHAGRLLLKNMVGSGMIRFVWKSSPPNGGALRSGNTSVESLGSVNGGAFPALSCQV